ncbi:MAG TPA: beta-N-acetylglucosaminidase domain-containing protein [Candidatus Binatia bacterium]|nr:beta-N-acetylglucosaminidase domain-containing protein [Candidatus Binatia bacterium]
MIESATFERRGIVEGVFGPLWSMAHRRRLFEFGAARGMNTYLYAPKDDPYHRKLWRLPYPPAEWRQLLGLIRQAQKNRIDFVYGFHPGEGLRFSDTTLVRTLVAKARRFYDAGVRTFAVLFDDIPSRLSHAQDRHAFKNSLARAEGAWLAEVEAHQPSSWSDVEWWICPSYYSEDDLLERVFGRFEPFFLETLAETLPANIACFWTGPKVVSRKIALNHVRTITDRIGHRPLLLWDNYPVNDLSMSDELHISPLSGRDPRLPQSVYGYLNNPLLQEDLGFLPLATCFDYAAAPRAYASERSWNRAVKERFGAKSLSYWRAIRRFAEASQRAKTSGRVLRWPQGEHSRLAAAFDYINAHGSEKWAWELAPWTTTIRQTLHSQRLAG